MHANATRIARRTATSAVVLALGVTFAAGAGAGSSSSGSSPIDTRGGDRTLEADTIPWPRTTPSIRASLDDDASVNGQLNAI